MLGDGAVKDSVRWRAMFGEVVVEGDVSWSCSGGRCWEMVR